MDLNELTVIIPFRNEKKEVSKTLFSLQKNYGNLCRIILINDASDDGYDYEKDFSLFTNVKYVLNEEALGVGGSRDKGALMAKTRFLLFLDSHCRLPDNVLVYLLSYAAQYQHRLICLQSRIMMYGRDKKMYLQSSACCNRAGFIDFTMIRGPLCLRWDYLKKEDANSDALDVPCVRGGAYCIEREYYLYLHGYNGLALHGVEDAFLSTKVWLEGGRCILLPKLEVYHLYRWNSPYPKNEIAEGYNKILFARLLMNDYGNDMEEAIAVRFCEASRKTIEENLFAINDRITEERLYLSSIFKRNFIDIIKLNRNNGNRIYPQ